MGWQAKEYGRAQFFFDIDDVIYKKRKKKTNKDDENHTVMHEVFSMVFQVFKKLSSSTDKKIYKIKSAFKI